MNVKLLTEHHLELLSLTGGCIGLSESTLVEIPHCLKSQVTAQILSTLRDTASCRCGRLHRPEALYLGYKGGFNVLTLVIIFSAASYTPISVVNF